MKEALNQACMSVWLVFNISKKALPYDIGSLDSLSWGRYSASYTKRPHRPICLSCNFGRKSQVTLFPPQNQRGNNGSSSVHPWSRYSIFSLRSSIAPGQTSHTFFRSISKYCRWSYPYLMCIREWYWLFKQRCLLIWQIFSDYKLKNFGLTPSSLWKI